MSVETLRLSLNLKSSPESQVMWIHLFRNTEAIRNATKTKRRLEFSCEVLRSSSNCDRGNGLIKILDTLISNLSYLSVTKGHMCIIMFKLSSFPLYN